MTNPGILPTGSTIGSGWADNMPLNTLGTILTQITNAAVDQQAHDPQKFWSTPARPATSTTHEVLQITLSTARLVNRMSFDVATFPQVITIEYFDDATKAWSPCLDSAGPVPVSHRVADCSPLILPPITSVTGHVHPQHSFSGHWKHLSFTLRPVVARLFRILLVRNPQGTLPVNPFGVLVDYSLAIRRFYCGYEVADIDDVPLDSPFTDIVTSNGSFASTTDLLGSTVNFSVRVNEAANVLRNANSATSVVWKCEPQPFPWAVVNFYVDARDSLGNPQVIDRFFLEPLYDGPNCHLYYSNDDATTQYPASTEPLPYPVAVIHDSKAVGGDVLHSGLAGLGNNAFVDIDNSVLSFTPSRSWWLGGSLNLKKGHGTETVDHPIFDCGAFQFAMTPFGVRCTTQYGDTVAVSVGPFDPATPMTFLVAYDGINTISVRVQIGSVTYSAFRQLGVPLTGATVTSLRIGGFQGPVPGIGDFDLNTLILKTDDIPSPTTQADFFVSTEPYVEISDFRVNTDARTSNALLRYHQGWATTAFPAGFVGGEPDHYADLNWSPIARDFVLRKGFYEIPPTKAKFWKFEFTGLVPESYEVYKPISRTVKTFTSSMWGTTSQPVVSPVTPLSQISALQNAVYQTNNTVTAAFDSYHFTQPGTGSASLGLTPTQVRVIWDHNSRHNVGALYWAWNFLPLHSFSTVPSFTQTGTHTYEKITVQQSTKIAYFVGLISVTAYRLDALSVDDNLRYVDNFFDSTNLDPTNNWILQSDHELTSGKSTYAVAKSQVMPSTRIVTAVQFAAQQSDPNQLLPDSDFDDPTHVNWTPVGDALLAPGIQTDVTVGTTLRISRASAPQIYTTFAGGYPFWHSITDQNLTFHQLETAALNPQLSGGITSASVQTPAGGRVSVAARVIAPVDLVAPLWVQIVDDTTNAVISQQPMTVKAHQVTEWYTSYSIGDVTTPPWRWADFFTVPQHALLTDSFHRANNSLLTTMDSGQTWSYPLDGNGNPLSLSIVNNQAVVTVEGDSDFIDVKALWGSLEFSVGTMGVSTNQTNLVPNPSFEVNTANWNTFNSATLVRQSGGTVGLFSGKVTATQATLNTAIATTVMTGIVGGSTYAYSADLNPSFTGTINLNVQWNDSTGTTILTNSLPASLTAGSWQHNDFNFTAPANAAQAICYFDAGPIPVNSTFSVDNVFFGLRTEKMLVNFDPFFLDDAGQLQDRSGTPLIPTYANLLTTNSTQRAVQAGDDIRIDIMPTTQVPSGRADYTKSANPDPVVWPYSLVVTVNGTWVRTLSHDLGARSLMGIKGRLNQKFASWSWSPKSYGNLTGKTIMYFPRLDQGAWQDPQTLTTFRDGDANTWSAVGSWDLSTPSEVTNSDNYGPPLTAAALGSVFTVDVGNWYGAMSAYVRNIAGGQSGGPHGYIFCLDYANGVYLDYAGNLISGGTTYANLVPGGITAGTRVTLHWARTAQVSATTRGSINPNTFPDMIIAKVNGAIVGTYASAQLQVWRGTLRGLCGDIYNVGTGVRPTAPNYTLDTSFRSFHWAPDASLVPAVPALITWDQVTDYSTITFDQVTQGRSLPTPRLRAQLVQYGQSTDVWDVDTFSLFVDPIVWAFSNDGGQTFFPAYDIRNDPSGVLSFPPSTVVTSLGRRPGTGLVWRATSYAPDRVISSLVIRPWYSGLLSGTTHKSALGATPNVTPYDHVPPIESDASFQVWHGPIPQSWYYRFRLLNRAINTVAP